jgi:hypothetical protein
VKAAAAKGAKDLNAAWDAAKEQIAPVTERPITETRAEAANYASNVVRCCAVRLAAELDHRRKRVDAEVSLMLFSRGTCM